MDIRVTHTTNYRYSQPVFLEPHTFRFCPRNDGAQLLRAFEWRVEPEPMSVARGLDVEGNVVVEATFTGLTSALKLESRFEAETLRANPFDFLLTPHALKLPFTYDDELRESLALYCRPQEGSDEVLRCAEEVRAAANSDTVGFLTELNQRLHAMTDKVIRHEGAPQPPSQTLAQRRGACRDLSVLFIEIGRSVGFAARFVSGYFVGADETEERHLHAWAEVYLPGGGWRGLDPTHGLAVADRHVTTAAGLTSQRAAPVSGSFRGTEAVAEMSASIQITATAANRQSQSQE